MENDLAPQNIESGIHKTDFKNCQLSDESRFLRQSTLKKHRYVLSLINETRNKNCSFEEFINRYNELAKIGKIDHLVPPRYLNVQEQLTALYQFHVQFDPYSADEVFDRPAREQKNNRSSWNPSFDVHIVLDRVRNAYNLGSIIRLVDSFGFAGIIHNLEKLSTRQRACRKAAIGSEERIPVSFERDLPAFLERRQKPLIVIEDDVNAKLIHKWEPPTCCYLVLGNESDGISKQLLDLADEIVSIHTYGYKRCYNVSVACIIVSEWITRHH